MNRKSAAAVVGFAAAVVLAFGFASGCGKPPTLPPDDPKSSGKKLDPWEAVATRLRKETDLAACKTALGQLNGDLAERTDVSRAAPMTDDSIRALSAVVPLMRDDLSELRPTAYSSLDPAYLVECFYMRDAARSLDPSGLPPVEVARLGFAWICRQLYLKAWEVEGTGFIPAIPPTYSLRRGYGSGLERSYVFLALLQQMGLDACLIGSPGASEKPTGAFAVGKDGQLVSVENKGPFWAVGVRVGSEIALFEPWRGEPFPGPGGKGIGTLAQVKANPNQLQAWRDDKTAPWAVTPDEVKDAAVFLAVPLSSLSPRMAMLEQKVREEAGVRLAIDPAALRARFAAAAPNGPGIEAKFWNLAGDRFTYCRSLIAFLPLEEGGLDRAELAQRLYSLYRQSLLPRSLLNIPPTLKPAAMERLGQTILGIYANAFFVSPSPRERIQRGQFQDAARDLTQKQSIFGRGLERLRHLDPAEIAEWSEAANAAYENLNRKRYPDPAQRTPQPDGDPDVIEAKNGIEDFWRNRDAVTRLLVDRSTAAIGRSEAGYLLALAKQEEAERHQVRLGTPGSEVGRTREIAADAWSEAANAWESFLEQNTSTALPARTDHAKKLAARAKSFTTAK